MSVTAELIKNVGSLSYFGIWGVAVLSNVVIPIPEEAVLLVLGFLSGTPAINGFIVAPVVFFGLLLSDIVMYFLSLHGTKVVNFFYKKVFASRLENRRAWMETHINKVIFFSRFLVQLRFLGPFMAGQMRLPFRQFLLYDVLALIIYIPLYICIGWYFHNRVEMIIDGIGKVRNIVIIIIAFIAVVSFSKFTYTFFTKKFLISKE